jgi:hypothetical protein
LHIGSKEAREMWNIVLEATQDNFIA